MTYRSDIDGLRAIAVVLVILFHAQVPGFGGGYVGVDVFFVISGYLITQLLEEHGQQPLRAQLKVFYLRRARRILPALFAISAFATAAAVCIFLPWDLATFGRYLAATAVFCTNFAAWTTGGGYFASKLMHLPLAHFWSIAIEEQFYLLYPLTFALICRYLAGRQRQALTALTLMAFAACILGRYHLSSAANYFLAPTRAWELLLGAVLAASGPRSLKAHWANEVLAVAAIATLAFVTEQYGPAIRYPGWYALAPCTAAAILIQTGRGRATLVARLLSLPPLVFTGLISYSLYLWHYPVFVIAGYYLHEELNAYQLGILIAFIYLLAVASWKWIEVPTRSRKILGSNRRFASWAFIASLGLMATGIVLWKSDGLTWRFPPETRARGTAWLWEGDFLPKCVNLTLEQIAAGRLCSVGPQDKDATPGLIWGDSHAMVLLPAYEELARRHHMRLYLAVRFSCRPLAGVINKVWKKSDREYCGGFNDAVVRAVQRLDPRLLILNAHWIDANADLIPLPGTEGDPGDSNFKRGLLGTLRKAGSSDRPTCIVMDVPEFKYDVPTALGVARKRGSTEEFLNLTRAQAQEHFSGPDQDIRALARQQPMVQVVDPKESLCRANSCIFESGGQLLYGDQDHLSRAGAHFIESTLDGCFREMASPAIN